MKQHILREIHDVDENHQLHIAVPAEMGNRFEVIILPIRPVNATEMLSDDQLFSLSAYASVIEDDADEDAVWGRYSNV